MQSLTYIHSVSIGAAPQEKSGRVQGLGLVTWFQVSDIMVIMNDAYNEWAGYHMVHGSAV